MGRLQQRGLPGQGRYLEGNRNGIMGGFQNIGKVG